MKRLVTGTGLSFGPLLFPSATWATDQPGDVPTWPAIIILLILAVGVLVVNWHNIKGSKTDKDRERKHPHP